MGNDSKLYGALAYLLGLLTGVLMLVIEPEDKYVKFHAIQSILFCIGVTAIYVALGMLFIPITIITMGLGAVLMLAVYGLLGLASFFAWAYLMYKAYNGEKYKLPVVGAMAEKYAAK